MKLSLAFSVALIGCLAFASAQGNEAESLLSAIRALPPSTEAYAVESLSGVDASSIIAYDRLDLALLPAAGAANSGARSVFSYWATNNVVAWKLTLSNVNSFTGAHLHLNNPPANGPIVVHLVPEFGQGDFVPPTNIGFRTYTGTFGTTELAQTLQVNSITQFIRDFVARNQIYVNVHGPGQAAVLQGFLNV